MPANYIDSGTFGIGISFPRKHAIDNKTYRTLIQKGFLKMRGTTHWLISRPEINRKVIDQFIESYNAEYFNL